MDEYVERKKRFTSKIFFYSAYILLLFKTICGRVEFIENIGEYITLLELVLLILCILIQSRFYKIKTVLFIALVLMICLYSYTITNNSNIMILFFFIFSMRNIDFDKFIKLDIKFKIIFLMFNIIFIYLGVLKNVISYRSDGTIRQALGFSSPNSFGGIVMSICFEWVYLKRKNLNSMVYVYLFLLIAVILIDVLSNSKTSEICIVLFMLILFVYKKNIYLKKLIPYMPILLTVISIILVYLYGKQNAMAIKLNEILTTRLECAYNFFELYDVNLFGNKFISSDVWLGYINTLDNGYLYLILNQGILLYVFVIYINIRLFKLAIKNDDRFLLSILIVFLFYAFMERTAYFVIYNVFLLYAKDLFYNNGIEKDNNNERINKYYSTNL